MSRQKEAQMGVRAAKHQRCLSHLPLLPQPPSCAEPDLYFCFSGRHLLFQRRTLTRAAPAAVCALNKHGSCRTIPLLPLLRDSVKQEKSEHAAHLCVGIVGVPGRPERFLPPYIPHQEVSVLHHYFLHVTSYGGGCVDHLIHQT